MALLKFLKGDYSKVNTTAIAEGQILVCSDTSEMFVDVAADKRIRIGDFSVVANVAALEALDATTIPTSRLYYIEANNTFAKSNGTNWVTINQQRTKEELIELLELQDLADIIAKKHEHINQAVLDGITIQNVIAWNGAEKNIINSVNPTQFIIDENRNLALLDIPMAKIAGLMSALENKVSKVDGSRLLTEAEAEKLEKLVIGENGSVEISGTIAAGNVEGLGDWITVRAGILKGLSENNLTDALIEKLNGIESNAQANSIEEITIEGKPLVISNKIIDIPIATLEQCGVVKSSAIENKVAINDDGTMEVNSINVNKLTQTDGDTLILYSGTSV